MKSRIKIKPDVEKMNREIYMGHLERLKTIQSHHNKSLGNIKTVKGQVTMDNQTKERKKINRTIFR